MTTVPSPSDPPISRLPAELVLDIMGRLLLSDLKRLVLASKRLRLIGGPFVYNIQKVPDVDHLVRLSVLASQPDVAGMILDLDIDAVAMEYWWLGLSHVLESLLPKLTSLTSLRLHTSRTLSPAICNAIAKLSSPPSSSLTTLTIKCSQVALGPHLQRIKNLKHIDLDLACPKARAHPSFVRSFDDLVAFLSASKDSLESLVLHEHAAACTEGLVRHTRRHEPLDNLLKSCKRLRSLSVNLEVGGDVTSALTAVDAVAGRPVTSLSLKCRPSIWPAIASRTGYGMGLEVVRRVAEKCGSKGGLRELKLEDGDVGKADLGAERLASGEVVEAHLTALRELAGLRSVELPLLMDDLLLYVPSSTPTTFSAPQTSPTPEAKSDDEAVAETQPSPPPSPQPQPADLVAAPRVEFHNTIDKTMTLAVQSLLLSPSPSDYDTGYSYPLPELDTLTFHLHPTPRLARDLRAMRVFAPAMVWRKRVLWSAGAPRLVDGPVDKGKGSLPRRFDS